MKLSQLTDAALYQKCKLYGANARTAMRKFEALLPEVYRRRLYKKRNCASIHEFASKLAGMSHEKVDRILQLSQKLEDKPKLREVFESGEVGYSKVAKVAYIAKPETEEIWAERVKNESRLAIELAVEKEREKQVSGNREETVPGNSSQPEKPTKWNTMSFKISKEDEIEFKAIKQKIEKFSGETLSAGETFSKILKLVKGMQISKEIKSVPEEKTVIHLCPECVAKKAQEAAQRGKVSRYVPISVKRLVLARQNSRCAHPECTNPPAELHHINGYTLTEAYGPGWIPGGPHSPEGLEYLCKDHHAETHAFDAHVQKYRQ